MRNVDGEVVVTIRCFDSKDSDSKHLTSVSLEIPSLRP